MMRTEIRLPGLVAAEGEVAVPTSRGARASRRKAPLLEGYFATAGDYERTLRFNVVAAPTAGVFQRGVEAALERLAGQSDPRRTLEPNALRALVENTIQDCLDEHLVHHKGVHGLRSVPRAAELSSAAGVALANLLVETFPGNGVMLETALRLADFSLKGQHPGGLFYGTYYLNEDSWLSPGAGPETPPEIRVDEAAEIACSLLRLGETLQAMGRPGNRYFLAGERVGEALLSSRTDLAEIGGTLHPDSLLSIGDGRAAVALTELFLRLHRRSGRDAHKKAVAVLFRRFYSQPPPPYAAALAAPLAVDATAAGANGKGSPGEEALELRANAGRVSLEAALRQARVAALLFEAGYRPRGLEQYLSRLLPWVCVNQRPLPDGLPMVGALFGELGAHQLVFRGLEVAYTALRLQHCLGSSREHRVLKAAVPQLVGFTLQKPLGTAWLKMDPAAKSPVGPVDSRVLVRELEALVRLRARFPAALW